MDSGESATPLQRPRRVDELVGDPQGDEILTDTAGYHRRIRAEAAAEAAEYVRNELARRLGGQAVEAESTQPVEPPQSVGMAKRFIGRLFTS